jgi:Skp family chaperone for outer membrane proteins
MKLVTSILLILTAFASAQKIASIDMKTTFLEFHKTIRFEVKMQEQKTIIEKHAAGLKKQYDSDILAYQKLQAEAAKISLSKEIRKAKSLDAMNKKSDIMNLKKDMESFMIDAKQLLRKQHNESRKTVLAEIQTIVEMVAKKNNYDLILDTSGKTSNLISIIVRSEKTADITAQTLSALNTGQEEFIREWKAKGKVKRTLNP